jgi:hypothetical protein
MAEVIRIYKVYQNYTPQLIYQIDGKRYERMHFIHYGGKLEADKIIRKCRAAGIPARLIVGDNGMYKGSPRGYWIYLGLKGISLSLLPFKPNMGREK